MEQLPERSAGLSVSPLIVFRARFQVKESSRIIVTLDVEDVVVEGTGENTATTIPFLEAWRDVISSLHVIIVLGQGLDAVRPNAQVKMKESIGKDVLRGIPAWLKSYEVYSQDAITAAWGDKSYLAGRRGLSLRNFGFWVSDRTIVFAVDKHTTPFIDPLGEFDGESGNRVIPPIVGGGDKKTIFERSRQQHKAHNRFLRTHLANLLTPATPSYFNPYYDAYKPGKDFPSGFPYDHRDGTFTAISHGLSTGDAHYDAFTRFVKPDEVNFKPDGTPITLTVPSGTLYSMAHNNVAFNRRVIGAVFMYPPTEAQDGSQIMSEGDSDVLAGWLTKVVCDHVGIGVKSGAPYAARAIVTEGADKGVEGSEEEVKATLEKLLNKAKSGMSVARDKAADGDSEVQPQGSYSHPHPPSLSLNKRVFEFLQSLLPSRLAYGDTKGNVARDKGCRGNIHAMEYGELNMAVECVYHVLAGEMEPRLGASSEGAKYKVK